MQTYLPYAIGVVVLIAVVAWAYVLIRRFRVYQQLVRESRDLCPLKEELEDKWEQFELEYRLKNVAYIPPKPFEKAEKSRDRVLPVLKNLCETHEPSEESNEKRELLTAIDVPADVFSSIPWRVIYFIGDVLRKIAGGIGFVVKLSLPKNKVTNLEEDISKLPELRASTNEAVSEVEKLIKSGKFLTYKENKRERESFQRKEREREIRNKRWVIEVLKRNLRGQIDYIMKRQQEESLSIGEPGIDRDLDVLDFGAAKETWEERIREIERLEEDENLLDDAITELETLGLSFQVEEENDQVKKEEGQKPQHTYIERRAVKIGKKVKSFNGLLEELEELERLMGTEVELTEEYGQVMTFIQEAGEQWASLDWANLRSTLTKIDKLLGILADRNANLREWARFIIPLKKKVMWLDEMSETITETHNIEITGSKTWANIKRKLEHEIPTYWAASNEEKLNELIPFIKGSINGRQQKLATRVLEKSEELGIKPDVSDRAVSVLVKLHNKILQGPEDEGNSPAVVRQTSHHHEPKVRRSGETYTTDLGTQVPAELKEAFEGTDARKRSEKEQSRE